ncbi:MAG: hypothetical protein MUC78_12420 [Bacteroidales bacterium]|jgi:hypothetical protein|nr:hypothetical protein [Bacteroidales bacterium]
MKKTAVILILSLFTAALGRAQIKDTLVQYTPDFKFRDGIYLNFEMVRSNSPIPKARLFTSVDYNDKDFFDAVLSGEKIYFYDSMGVRQEIEKNSIWGFSRNGVLYIKVQDTFNRITFFGSIIHFVADVTSVSQNNPYGYYDPYYSPYGSYGYPYNRGYYNPYSPYYSPYSSYGYPYNSQPSTRTDLKMFMIDFETGNEYEYDLENLEALLMKDPELYEEFVSMKNKNQKKMMFVYLRKFNEKHPIYLPTGK